MDEQQSTPTEQIAPSAAPASTASDAEQNKVMGILAYIGILCLVPLLAAPKSPFARYHANQGLILFIGEVAVWVVSSILWILVPLAILLNLGFLILAIIGIINAASGQMKPLPLVGTIQILK